MKQFDLFSEAPTNKVGKKKSAGKRTEITVKAFFDGKLEYTPNFYNEEYATKLLQTLQQTLAWQQDEVKVYGKWHKIPRLQAWYGDKSALYRYSGKLMEPLPWTSELLRLKAHCEQACDTSFNSVLANLYRDGQDCMGFHCDDEPELGNEPVIASLSFGALRDFDLLHKTAPVKVRIKPAPGSLLVMAGSTQKHWRHGITRTAKTIGQRINLTFRQINSLG